MGRVTQNPPAPPDQPIQAPEPQPAPPPKPHHVEEAKPIPVVEPPLAVHNLVEQAPPTVISKPILPLVPIVIEIDPATVPQVTVAEITVSPALVASLPPVQHYDLGVIEMTTHVVVPPHFQFLTPTFTNDDKPAAVVRDTKTNDVIVIELPEPVGNTPLVLAKPQVPVIPALPEPKKTVTPEPESLRRKLAPGDIVDGDILPPSEKKWSPAADNKTIRWFDMKWKSDGSYELVNWCVFMTHMELELRRL